MMMALIFFMGVGPLMPWRRASFRTLRGVLMGPLLLALAVVVLLAVLGVRKPYPMAAFGICAMVTGGILLEWARGARSRHRQGDNYLVGFLKLIAANRPRYGGYVVHLAVVMLALGVVGSSFYDVQEDVILAPGERAEIGGYQIEYVGTDVSQKVDRQESVTTLNAYRDGSFLRTLTARRDFYPAFSMSSTKAGIHSTPVEDLYVVPSETMEDGRSGFRVLVNPLVWWMWVAGPVFMLGTVISLWPRRAPEGSLVSERLSDPVALPSDRPVRGQSGDD